MRRRACLSLIDGCHFDNVFGAGIMRANELCDARSDVPAEAGAVKNAVVANVGDFIVKSHIIADAWRNVVRSPALAKARDVVFFP